MYSKTGASAALQNLSMEFPAGGGEMGELIRSFDWSKTPLGPTEHWSPTLKTMVSFLLANRFPLLLWWGPGYISIYNDAYRPILGIKHPAEALGKPVHECWSEIWPVLKPLIDTPFHGGPATWIEDLELEIHRHGFTEESHFTVAYSPVPDESAQRSIGGVLATVHEITQKVINERRIAALRDLGASAAEAKTAADACIAAAETLGRNAKDVPFALLYLLDQDQQEARLIATSGIPEGDTAGPRCIDLRSPDAKSAWPFAECIHTEAIVAVEDLPTWMSSVPRGPWSDSPRAAVIVPIRSNTPHQLAGLLVSGVSSRLKLDVAYRSFFELAAAQIATAIANARAYEEERRRAEALAAIDRAKTTFFSNVSHEFRTPLTLMLGPIEEAAAHPATPAPVRTQLALAQRNSLRLLKLVNTLLDFSRIEAGRVQASYEPTDLAAFTRDLASIFRSAIERAGLVFSIECDDLGEVVYIDREMWEKIVLNLLSNAFKFTLIGSITVRLRRDGPSAVLEVADTGAGVPQEELPRLFERFHRIENAQARTHEGSGIGLSLVHELVKLQGGMIEAASEFGRGATFRVQLPFGVTHLPPEQVKGPRSLAATAANAQTFVQEALSWLPRGEPDSESAMRLRMLAEVPARGLDQRFASTFGARILLVDDNADMRAYVRDLLAPHYLIKAVADGAAALEAILGERPHLVLSDVMMPRLSGFDLLAALRADEALRDIPLILLSARAGEESRIEGFDAGADDYLVKPFSARELLARVGALLELSQMRREKEERLRAETAALSLLNEANSRLWRKQTLTEGLNEMLGATIELLGADMGNVQLLDPDRRVLRIGAQHGFQPPFLEFFREVSTEDDSACGRTLRSGQRTVIEDVETDPPYAPLRPVARAAGYRAVQSTPLMSRDGLPLGMLSTHWRAVRRPSEQEMRRLDLYARHAADFIEWCRSAAALHESEEKLRLATEAGEVGLWDVDLITNTLFWPPRVKAMFGISPEVPVSMADFYSGLHTEDRQRTSEAFAAALDPEQRALYDVEYRTVGKEDGLIRWVAARGRAIFDGNGMCVRVIGTAIDITARKRTEEALSEADRRKDEFLAMLAHELRNPLAPISTAGELLSRTITKDSRTRSTIEMIKRQTRQLTRLVDDLLDVSRITQGRIELHRGPIDLASVIAQAVEAVEPLLRAKQHRLSTLQASYEPLYVDGDHARLMQCVVNVLTNAAKYTDPGGEIRIQSRADGKHAVIEITDTGSGISPELLPKVFDLFVQSDRTLDRAQGGLGIGLAVVKRLVEMQGGTVSARSPGLGRGSTFEIRLPRVARPQISIAETTQVKTPPRRVLIVDDNQDAANALSDLLNLHGHQTQVAFNGRQALEDIESFHPDVALLDLGLPEMDGFALAGRLRAMSKLNGIRLVALTGYGQAEDRQRTQAAGFDDHLVKPVDFAALERTMAGSAASRGQDD